MDFVRDIMKSYGIPPLPEKTVEGMAYVPFQYWEKPYAENVGFVRGTIFQSLDFPFIGEEAVPDANDNKRR